MTVAAAIVRRERGAYLPEDMKRAQGYTRQRTKVRSQRPSEQWRIDWRYINGVGEKLSLL